MAARFRRCSWHSGGHGCEARRPHRRSEAADYLGLPLQTEPRQEDLRFAFRRHYDLAILGWRLSAYPAYLCDWFGEGNAFGYQSSQIATACRSLASTSDLEAARQLFAGIQSDLGPALFPSARDNLRCAHDVTIRPTACWIPGCVRRSSLSGA
jgi:hypothetical protein